MSESHWGSRTPKGALLTAIVAVLLMSGLIALFFWSPWVEPTEVDWVQDYETWSEITETSLAAGLETRESCESRFDAEVGDPPRERLESAARAARGGCESLSPDGWQRAQADVVRAIRDAHAAEIPPRQARALSELARSIAGQDVNVYCWSGEGWAPFFEHYALVRGDDESSLRGLSDTSEGRIDLEPGICAGLRRHVARNRPPAISGENFRMAQALVVLAHHAEHFASPSASEPERECFAVQHVRPLMRARGWDPDYVREIVLQAWELLYAQLPAQLRTPECRNGGPLDRNPGSDDWP